MPTLNKLEYLDETKGQIKDALNTNFNSGITEEDTFRSYVSKISDIYTNWPKVEGEGTDLSLSNTKKGLMKVDLKGNTSQESTTGKNLFDSGTALIEDFLTPNNVAYTISGGVYTVNGSNIHPYSYLRQNLELEAGTYILTGCPSGGSNDGYSAIVKVGQTSYFDYGDGVLFTLDTSQEVYVYPMRTGSSIISLNNVEFKPMIRKSDVSDTTFEPYTGGQPAPSPSYPFPIHVVSGNNTIKVANGDNTEYEEYPISLGNIKLCKIGTYQDSIKKSTGKNLFDNSTITENKTINGGTGELIDSSVSNLTDYIEISPNTTYTLTYNYFSLLNTTDRGFGYYDSNKNLINSSGYQAINKTNYFIAPQNAKYIRFGYDRNCFNIMLNKGSTALPYEPYGKVWYLNKQIGKVVLDGSEDWRTSGVSNNAYFTDSFYGINPNANDTNVYTTSNYYQGTYRNNIANVDYGISLANNATYNYGNFILKNKDISSISDFQTWLSNNNTTVYYVLATPTYTEITGELLSQLEALAYSYDEQTNISQVNDDLGFIISASALMKGGN